MRIIVREAGDDFEAFRIANAMESRGANVFSIAYNGQHQREGAMIPSSRFLVWAKIESDASVAAIDDAIAQAMK